MLTLQATARNPKEDKDILRKEAKIPAVFYGAGKESTPISVNTKEFKKVLEDAGESTSIKVEIGNEKLDAMIHDVAFHPVSGEVLHADFLIIDASKTIQVAVPIEFDGESPLAKSGKGIIIKVLHEIEIEALPKNLPHAIHIDISGIENLEDQITVADMILPEGVTAVTEGTEVVVSVSAPTEEKEEVAPVDLSSIEVEKKGKQESEEESADADK